MLPFPPNIVANYRPATEHEIRARSFGTLNAPRNLGARSWEQRRGTLEDQAIFGPLNDFECACGRYQGPQFRGSICDRCGVKSAACAERRQRFGHIDLTIPIDHPLYPGEKLLGAIPVLPSTFIDSDGGAELSDIYDELVRSIMIKSFDELARSFDHLLKLLVPAFTVAHEWDLQDAEALAFGLALVPREYASSM